jgi:hypothetical protein
MKKRVILLLLALPAGFLLIAGFYRPASTKLVSPETLYSWRSRIPADAPLRIEEAAGPGFAVVELFTSEGCSSCPPADAVLARIAAENKDNVYVLGFHVDYWDRLGWKDAFSNAAYTHRQQEYGRVLRLSSIYTPEAVVNGEREMVGSDEKALRSVIAEDLKKPGGKKIVLHAVGAGAGTGAGAGVTIKVNYQVADRGEDVLYLALVQAHAETKVGAGENNGKKLEHVNIVRDLKTAAGSAGSVEFAAPQGLTAKDCKVIAFLQSNKGGGITLTGASGADIP